MKLAEIQQLREKSLAVKAAFDKKFPKVHEKPGLHPYKEEILGIVMDTLEELTCMH